MFSPLHGEPRGTYSLPQPAPEDTQAPHIWQSHSEAFGTTYNFMWVLGASVLKAGSVAADLHVVERSWEVAKASRIKDGVYETTVV